MKSSSYHCGVKRIRHPGSAAPCLNGCALRQTFRRHCGRIVRKAAGKYFSAVPDEIRKLPLLQGMLWFFPASRPWSDVWARFLHRRRNFGLCCSLLSVLSSTIRGLLRRFREQRSSNFAGCLSFHAVLMSVCNPGKFENSRTSLFGKIKIFYSWKTVALQRIHTPKHNFAATSFIIPTVFGFVNTFRHEI